ncbi:MAG: hypothetical protein JRG91_13215 [Deltaproteobacteria bacterium]|nr:hypothetical protein [Deltaproteobacteria bacterium]
MNDDINVDMENDMGVDVDVIDDVHPDMVDDVGVDVVDDVHPDTGDDVGVDTAPDYFTLTVSVVGLGTVTSTPAGIDCGSDCTEDYLDGTVVTLAAAPDTGATFTGWSGGGCSGTGTCVVTLTAATTVTATFTLGRYALTVTRAGTGSGTVTSSPTGISCGTDCSETYDHGTGVTLTAAASTGSTFSGWSGGGCSGTGTCVVTLMSATTVTATFTLNRYALTVTRAGTGSGAVTSSPAGISCGTDCSETYDHGTGVTLTAAASTGSTFSGWSGGGCSGTGSCVVTLTAAMTVTATFTLNRYVLTVTRAGSGSGSVTSTPAGISCGTDCSEAYSHGTAVTLTAAAGSGSVFTGWSGGGCSGTGSCVVTLTAAMTVTATFGPKIYNVAFISPVPTNAMMGGLSGADTLCRGWAASAGIGGTYRAILSTTTTHASTRLGSARGWVRPDGRPVGDLPSEIFSYSDGLLAPLWITTDGSNVGVKSVWSASNNTGTYSTWHTDCGAWTSASTTDTARYGFSNVTAEWLDRGTATYCDELLHIYCFQVDHTTPLDMSDFTESGRIIFVSTGDFNVTSGLSGADALCASDASTYGALSGRSFLAFLASSGTTAASRFSGGTTPIVRVDGLRVADHFTALTTSDLIHPPSIKADGSTETWRVFVGANNPTTAGTASFTCNGWTSTSSSATEGFAYSVSVLTGARQWFGNTSGSCSSHTSTVPVYCLEI